MSTLVTREGGNRPWATTPGTASSMAARRRGVVDVAVVVGEHPAVGRQRRIAQHRAGERAQGGRQPEGQELQRDRRTETIDRLVRGHDDHEAIRRRGHDPLAGVRPSPALDQPADGVDLVGPVDGQVESIDVGEGPDVEPDGAGELCGGRRGRGTGDVQPARARGREPARPRWNRCPGRPTCRPRPARPRSRRRRASRPGGQVPSPPARAQLRGTSFQGSSLSVRTSPGRPSTRSPRMLRMTSEVPPSMELARTRRNILCTSVEPMPTRSGRTMG